MCRSIRRLFYFIMPSLHISNRYLVEQKVDCVNVKPLCVCYNMQRCILHKEMVPFNLEFLEAREVKAMLSEQSSLKIDNEEPH